MFKELCSWLVVCVMLGFATHYAYQVYLKRNDPTPSTWIIFLLGTTLSFTTYLMSAGEHTFETGILNAMDVVVVTIALIATLLWGKRTMIRFRRFEFLYLAAAGCVILYGVVSGNAFQSNLFAQGLITFGYFPTVQKMVRENRNTESFSSWGIGLLAGFIGLIPATLNHDTLAVTYALRTIIMIAVIMLISAHYALRDEYF